eukprot:4047069-Amphidinium_carterae.1
MPPTASLPLQSVEGKASAVLSAHLVSRLVVHMRILGNPRSVLASLRFQTSVPNELQTGQVVAPD